MGGKGVEKVGAILGHLGEIDGIPEIVHLLKAFFRELSIAIVA